MSYLNLFIIVILVSPHLHDVIAWFISYVENNNPYIVLILEFTEIFLVKCFWIVQFESFKFFCLLLKLLGNYVIDTVLLEEISCHAPFEARIIIVLDIHDTLRISDPF
jgi:hypothetical protein